MLRSEEAAQSICLFLRRSFQLSLYHSRSRQVKADVYTLELRARQTVRTPRPYREGCGLLQGVVSACVRVERAPATGLGRRRGL